jgi:hypothetical protein
MSASFGFVSSILKIIENIAAQIPNIKDIPYIGPMLMDKNGRWKGAAGFIFYKILGIDNHGGLLGIAKKIFSGKLTKQEILALLNPMRILNVSTV